MSIFSYGIFLLYMHKLHMCCIFFFIDAFLHWKMFRTDLSITTRTLTLVGVQYCINLNLTSMFWSTVLYKCNTDFYIFQYGFQYYFPRSSSIFKTESSITSLSLPQRSILSEDPPSYTFFNTEETITGLSLPQC